MNCLVCQKPLDEMTPLCADHAPAWGKCLHFGKTTIVAGELKLSDVIFVKFMRRKLVRWWLGSDVWILHTFPKGRGKISVLRHRFVYYFTKRYVDENWITSEKLKDEFEACGGEKAIVRYHIRGMLTEKVDKSAINIGYYWPAKGGQYQYDIYGIDIIEQAKKIFPEVNWLRLDGSLDMRVIYSILDGYVRPSRRDGKPRMIEECKINGTPYYWSEDGNPNLDDICDFVGNVICSKKNSTTNS